MPWHIEKKGSEYCVVKDADGEVEGCHGTRADAAEQIRALYASEDDDPEMAIASHSVNIVLAMDIREEDGNYCVYDLTGTNLGCWGDRELAEEFILTTTGELVDVEDDSEEHVQDVARQLRVLIDQLIGEDDANVPAPAEDAIEEDAYSAIGASWSGPIAFEEEYTGDGRIFRAGSIKWDESQLPFTFRWQKSSVPGHDTAVTIGRVDRLERRDGGVIWGEGVILNTNQEAWEYLQLIANGAAGGVSVDGDSAEFEVLEVDGAAEMHFSSMRLRALTAVDIPAFANARISISAEALLAAAVGDLSVPMGDRDARYDGLAAQKRIFAWAKTADGYDASKLARAFLWRDSDGDPQLKGSYKLPFTDVVGGTLKAMPKAIFAAAGALEGARGGVNIPEADKAAIRSKLNTLYGKIEGDPVPPWKDPKGDGRNSDNEAAVETVITAAAIPVKPPAEWFESPELPQPTPITVSPDGKVFGHLALFGTCHIGFKDCVTPPKGSTYAYFHTGEIEAEGGELVAVGHLTFNTGHAALDASPAGAASHYDHTGTVAADVRVGEDKFGIWVSGALRSTLSDEDIRAFRSAPLSGDWRRIAGRLELVAALAVNTPGFPVARSLVAGGNAQSLVTGTPDFEEAQMAARRSVKARIANSLRKQDINKRIGGK